MKILATQRCDYAVRAVCFLASLDGRVANAGEISDETGVPMAALHQLMQSLSRAQLVSSRTGPRGGYRLSQDPATISVRDVVEAVEGPIDPGFCELSGMFCPTASPCALHAVWAKAQQTFRDELGSMSLTCLVTGGQFEVC